MSIFDLLSMAFLNLWRRKLRAALTVLGMIVGTASIVVMISLGIGVNASYMESLERTGSLTVVRVQSQSNEATMSRGGMAVSIGGTTKTVKLDDKAVRKFRQIEGVRAVSPIVFGYGALLKTGKYFSGVQLIGIDTTAAEQFGVKIAEGTMFKRNDSKPEIVLGSEIVKTFSDPDTYRPAIDKNGNPLIKPLTASMKLTFDYNNVTRKQPTLAGDSTVPQQSPGKIYKAKITGLIAPTNGGEVDYQAFTDINTLKKLAKENKDYFYGYTSGSYNEIWVKCDSVEDVDRIQKEIKKQGYGAWSLADALNMAKESSKQLQALLGAIGGVSLFVAAIGIMNTMLMSIYERTKEIGIIKVLGCRMGNILSLFLVEAAYIGIIGGVLGVGVSYAISLGINKILAGSMGGGMQSVIPLYLSLGALAFSAFVAIASGFYPAVKATRLSALGAIRSE